MGIREKVKSRVLETIENSTEPIGLEAIRKNVGTNYITIERAILEIIIEALQERIELYRELNIPFVAMKTSKSLVLIPKRIFFGHSREGGDMQ